MKIEVYTDKRGEHRFRAVADNGQIVAVGEGYTLRVTDEYENDRVEISVEVNEGDNVAEAIALAKETCLRALDDALGSLIDGAPLAPDEGGDIPF